MASRLTVAYTEKGRAKWMKLKFSEDATTNAQ